MCKNFVWLMKGTSWRLFKYYICRLEVREVVVGLQLLMLIGGWGVYKQYAVFCLYFNHASLLRDARPSCGTEKISWVILDSSSSREFRSIIFYWLELFWSIRNHWPELFRSLTYFFTKYLLDCYLRNPYIFHPKYII